MLRLKGLRQHAKKTREEMAEMLGVSFSTYRAYEQGKHEPSIANLIKLSHILKVSIDFLVGNDDYKTDKRD